MGMDNQNPLVAVALLDNPHSAKRRSGAKRLRKLKDPAAGPALLATLKREIADPRTWETQYHLIMALGACGYTPALGYLKELSSRPFPASMIYMALGDTLLRLARTHEHDATPALDLIATGNKKLIEGALRAIAMLRMVPDPEQIRQILAYITHQPLVFGAEFWVAAAAPGWSGPEVDRFLARAVRAHSEETRRAALAAQQKMYLPWRPL